MTTSSGPTGREFEQAQLDARGAFLEETLSGTEDDWEHHEAVFIDEVVPPAPWTQRSTCSQRVSDPPSARLAIAAIAVTTSARING